MKIDITPALIEDLLNLTESPQTSHGLNHKPRHLVRRGLAFHFGHTRTNSNQMGHPLYGITPEGISLLETQGVIPLGTLDKLLQENLN